MFSELFCVVLQVQDFQQPFNYIVHLLECLRFVFVTLGATLNVVCICPVELEIGFVVVVVYLWVVGFP